MKISPLPLSSSSSSPLNPTTFAIDRLAYLAKDALALCVLYFLEQNQISPLACRVAATARARARDAVDELERATREMLVQVVMQDLRGQTGEDEGVSKNCHNYAQAQVKLKNEVMRMCSL